MPAPGGNLEIKGDANISCVQARMDKKADVRSAVGELSKIIFTDTGE